MLISLAPHTVSFLDLQAPRRSHGAAPGSTLGGALAQRVAAWPTGVLHSAYSCSPWCSLPAAAGRLDRSQPRRPGPARRRRPRRLRRRPPRAMQPSPLALGRSRELGMRGPGCGVTDSASQYLLPASTGTPHGKATAERYRVGITGTTGTRAHVAWTKASGLGCGTGGHGPLWRAPEPSKIRSSTRRSAVATAGVVDKCCRFIVGARHPCGAVVVEWRSLRVSALLLGLKLLH